MKPRSAIAPLAAAFLFASLTTSRLLARSGHHMLTAGASWPHVSALALAPGFVVVGLGQG